MSRILCVEDEPQLLTFLVEELSSAGYEAAAAESGAAALAMMDGFRPDLVLSDVNMPGGSGYDLLMELRLNRPGHDHVPFVFMSALVDRADILKGKALADDYLVKPVDVEMLLATVHARLSHTQRMIDRHQLDLVKLYRHLTRGEPPPLVLLAAGDVETIESVCLAAKGLLVRLEIAPTEKDCIRRICRDRPAAIIASYYRKDAVAAAIRENAQGCGLGAILAAPRYLRAKMNAIDRKNFSNVLFIPCSVEMLRDSLATANVICPIRDATNLRVG
jgi:CheY-like chemotaxis protein